MSRTRYRPAAAPATLDILAVLAILLTWCLVACTSPSSAPVPPAGSAMASTAGAVPRFDHIVIAVVENHSYAEILDQGHAPFLSRLAATGATLTQSFAVTHPSEPNYLALFSGSTQGLTDDSCPHEYRGSNLAGELLAGGLSFAGFSESQPSVGFTGCRAGAYARKHNPWSDFPALPATVNQPMTAFPADYTALPTVSFVVPNLDHDMHDGSVATGDAWLGDHLGGYAAWAATHNSLLIVTADEDDSRGDNRIATILTGAHVAPGSYLQHTTHYGILRTVLDSYRLAPIGEAAATAPVGGLWRS